MPDEKDRTPDTPAPDTPAAPEKPDAPEKAAAPKKPAPKASAADALTAEVPSPALDRLREAHGAAVLDVGYFAGEVHVTVRREALVEVLGFLRDDPACSFRYLANLSATHFPDREDGPLEVVYHLYSIDKNQRLNLKVRAGLDDEVPSATAVYRTANWHEREAFDLLGVRFAGHPELKRILLTDEWDGHPLRKDYPLEGNPGDHKSYR